MISLLSSQGILPADQLRLPPDDTMKSFIKSIPTVSPRVAEKCSDLLKYYEHNGDFFVSDYPILIQRLTRNVGVITGITARDVVRELQSRLFPENEMVSFLKWLVAQVKQNKLPIELIRQYMSEALISLSHAILPLQDIKYFINPKIIPTGDTSLYYVTK